MPKMSTRRKLAIATWSAPNEGNIYGKLSVDATRALAYLDKVREETGEKVTITHFVGKVVAAALREAPGLNGYLRFGAFHPHDTVDLAFLVALEEGSDLGKVKVERADEKRLEDLAREFGAAAAKLRAGKDQQFKKSNNLARLLPTWVIRPLLRFIGWLTGSIGLSLPSAGLEAFPFGACIITSVGMLGLDEGFVPPTPFARVPVYVLLGAIRDQPVVEDGQIVVRPMLTITATIDHRFMDGFQGGVLARKVREIFADPTLLYPAG
ncbi:MAG: 2-oxo acid dehydrogenase subunit E2 [Polyangiales bacterium]|nr:2-oxo acid dehydrogenase subunit E2 [Myxococcales bacterium]MCB9662092.1 2-oxo acid dehydrogenase subunit E2 [Sandaracinaceae bacterium]